MRTDAAPSTCEVVSCDEPATASYLHARDARLLEFSICTDHYFRMQNGEQATVVAKGGELTPLEGRTALVIAPRE